MEVRAPQTQKAEARPISFVLDDQSTGSPPVSLSLVIRPEDLTRTDPSRITTQQTLGGAWADNFGPGIPTISISGHTGWRRRLVNDDDSDGGERFAALFDSVFTRWHTLRNDAMRAGTDPDRVRLVFADALDQFAVVVAPTSFVLRRSKSRPLLSQYQITMMVLSQDIDELAYLQFGNPVLGADALEAAGLDSMSESMGRLSEYLEDIQNFVDSTLVNPVRDIMDKSIRMFEHVRESVLADAETAGDLVASARVVSRAGVNIFRSIGALAEIPSQVRARLMQISAAFSNIFCVLRNALRQQEKLPNYEPLYGSSNCSSTSGGRPISPLSSINPFTLYVPSNQPLPVSFTGQASAALTTMANTDVVLAPPSSTSLLATLNQISIGLVVS